ncbi:MAG: YqhA family protein [Dissulfurispiraceae bacterium]|jgi:uncharacterized membrane protein YqhA
MTLIGFLLKMRYLAAVAVLFSVLSGMALMAIGVCESVHAYQIILAGIPWESGKHPVQQIGESIDTFLVALVLIVLALGLTELFLVGDDEKDACLIPSWIRVKSFLELKLLLWEVVLTVLVVAFLGQALGQAEDLHWEVMILPASILMLAISLFIMKKISGGHH